MKAANATHGATNPHRLILRVVAFETICFPVRVKQLKSNAARLVWHHDNIERRRQEADDKYTDNLDLSRCHFSFDL